MKLLVPVNNFESTVRQIEAGGEELYLGADSSTFHNLSFNGRGRLNPKGERNCPDFKELKDIVQYAHEKDVQVMFTANLPFLANNPDGSREYLKLFIKYVTDAIEAGVDSVIVADLGAVQILRKEGINIHIAASTFFEIINKEQIACLEELGVNRVVLSYQLTMEEIMELTESTKLEIEIFGHYGCSFYDDCNLKHNFGEQTADLLGVPCRNVYDVTENGTFTHSCQFLNASLACSVCSMRRLQEAGVYATKLVGRDLDMDMNYQITAVYSKLLHALREKQMTAEEYNALRGEVLPEWWRRVYCRKQQCKYLPGLTTGSYIGLDEL